MSIFHCVANCLLVLVKCIVYTRLLKCDCSFVLLIWKCCVLCLDMCPWFPLAAPSMLTLDTLAGHFFLLSFQGTSPGGHPLIPPQLCRSGRMESEWELGACSSSSSVGSQFLCKYIIVCLIWNNNSSFMPLSYLMGELSRCFPFATSHLGPTAWDEKRFITYDVLGRCVQVRWTYVIDISNYVSLIPLLVFNS